MKPKSILTALAAALLAPGALFAQTTATTTPVGYITHSIAGAGTEPAAETYVAATLVQSNEFVGQTTVTPSGGDVATFSGGVPASLNGEYVLEITTGPNAGWWSTVVSSNSTTVTVFDEFPASLPANTQISIRKHSTLQNFMGLNTPGLVEFNGSDASDEVQIFDPVTQSAISYVFVSGDNLGDPSFPDGAWFNLNTSLPEAVTVITPGSSVVVKRIGSSALSFVSTGTVKTTSTQVDVYDGFTFIGATNAGSGTLDSYNFADQLNPWDGSQSEGYDELQILGADQQGTIFTAIDEGTKVIWSISASDYAGTTPFPAGTGLVFRRIGIAASTITIPGSTVAP